MKQAISTFWNQFSYTPEITYAEHLPVFEYVVVIGMGGSHLAGDIIATFGRPWFIHHDYGLPHLPPAILKKALCVVVSYSGSTEEAIDSYIHLQQSGCSVAIVTTGGQLETLAKTDHTPHVILPAVGIQPRAALGYQLLALASITKQTDLVDQLHRLAVNQHPDTEQQGRTLARETGQKTPIIYSSQKNKGLSYFWKITINETGKQPGFYNLFPELNHNEFTGFDVGPSYPGSQDFHIILLQDPVDHSQIKKRMVLTRDILQAKGYQVSLIELPPSTPVEKITESCHMAMWYALERSVISDSESEQVPMIEDFKKKLTQ